MESGPPRVTLHVPPHVGTLLLAWGTPPTGGWWALVCWERWITTGLARPQRLWCSGWVAAPEVQRIDGQDYSQVVRLTLDGDRRWWPTSPAPPLGHFGLLSADSDLKPPEGYYWSRPRN